jgi:hypothetical protein
MLPAGILKIHFLLYRICKPRIYDVQIIDPETNQQFKTLSFSR